MPPGLGTLAAGSQFQYDEDDTDDNTDDDDDPGPGLYDPIDPDDPPKGGFLLPPRGGVAVRFKNEQGEGAAVRREWFSELAENGSDYTHGLFTSFDQNQVRPLGLFQMQDTSC